MRTRRHIASYLSVAALLLLPAPDSRCEAPRAEDVAAEVSAGYHLYNPSGYRGKVGEYEVLDTGTETRFFLEGRGESSWLKLRGEVLDKDDQTYDLRLDLQHVLRSKIFYQRFRHFLDHDPLTNQDSAVDFNRNERNLLTVEEFAARTALELHALPIVRLTGDVRTYSTHGTRQALTVAKCSSCHVASRNRRVDTSINDVMPGATVSLGPATLQYTMLLRDFTEHGAAPVNNYGDGSSLFLVRGAAPYSRTPDSRTRLHTFAVQSQLPLSSSLALRVQHGKRENKFTGDETGITSIAARITSRLSRFFSHNVFYARHRTNTRSRNGVDQDRQRGGIEVFARSPGLGSLACAYTWEHVGRDHATPLTTHRDIYRLSYARTLRRTLRIQLFYQRTKNDDPLKVKNRADRRVEQTSLPEHEHETGARFAWSPRHNVSLNTHLTMLSGRNNDVHADEDRMEICASFWYAPSQIFSLSGSYIAITDDIHGRGAMKIHHARDPDALIRYRDMPYDSRSRSWQLGARLVITRRFTLTGDLIRTESFADLDVRDSGRDAGRFSDLSLVQSELSVGTIYEFSRTLSLYTKYAYRDYNDRSHSRFDGRTSRVACGMTWSY